MSIIKNITNFVSFFNIFVFIFYVLINLSVEGTVPLKINIGIIRINTDISLFSIIISILIAFIVLAIVSGINAISSGLNESGTSNVIRVISLFVLYSIISLFTLSFLNPLGIFGTILYGLMSIMYVLNYLEKRSESD